MAWLYLPDTVASSLELTRHSEEYAPWVTLSGKATQRPLSWRGWEKRPWIKLLSGTTLLPSTAARGAESWISSVRDSRVSPSVPQENSAAQQTSDGFGTISRESFAKFNPDGSLVKTSLDLFLLDSTPYCDPLPASGMMLAGELFEQNRWEPATDESAFSSSLGWPKTPMASDGEGGTMEVKAEANAKLKLRDYGVSWPNMENWPTPDASAHKYRMQGDSQASNSLEPRSRNWSMQIAMEDHYNMTSHQPGLVGMTHTWPTPAARDEKGTNRSPKERGKLGQLAQANQLPNYVQHNWRPPEIDGQLESHYSLQALRPSICGPECSPKHRRLNPAFVEWLMGLPSCWTVAKIGSGPAATELSHYKQQLQFACLQIVQDGI